MKKIISAAVTPFTSDNKIDLKSAANLYEFGLTCGLDGFFILGSMGEWALLTDEEKTALAGCACDVIGDRADILLGISDTGLPNILRNMEQLSHLKHSHWTVILPGGWPGPACPVKYLHRIADEADRPLYYYHIPPFNGVNISTEQFGDILAHPKIVGIKNSAGSIRLRKELLFLKKTVDFKLFEGEEWSIDEALIGGCDGAVAGFGSVGAKLMKTIARHVEEGQIESAKECQFKLIEIFHGVYGGAHAPWWNVGQKYALEYMGIISSTVSRIDDQQTLPEDRKAAIRACIDTNRDYIL